MAGFWLVVSRRRRPVLAWLALIISSLIWLRVDKHDEGRILLVFDQSHGLTQADLFVPAVIIGAVALRWYRHRARG